MPSLRITAVKWLSPVPFVRAKATLTACALLEFTEAPVHILRVPNFVDIGIPIAVLGKCALCLISWPAAIFTQTAPSSVPALTCQPTAGSL